MRGQVHSQSSLRQGSHPSFEPLERFWSDLALGFPLVADTKAEKAPLAYRRHRTFGLVDLQTQPLYKKTADTAHHSLTGSLTAYINVAIICVPAESQPPTRQFLVQLVEDQIRKQGRQYTPNKVAQSLLEFSTSIPRNELRPSYGEGFLGAPIHIGMHRQAPTPAVQGDDRGSSKSSTPSNPGDSHHV